MYTFLYSISVCRLTFRLYATFQPAYKANRKVCGGLECAGMSRGRRSRPRRMEAEGALAPDVHTILLCDVKSALHHIFITLIMFLYYFVNQNHSPSFGKSGKPVILGKGESVPPKSDNIERALDAPS